MKTNIAPPPAVTLEELLSDRERTLRSDEARRIEELKAKIASACPDSALPKVHSETGVY
jgi:hypothetical protein